MMRAINEVMLAVSSSLAASIIVKATVVAALALIGARLARGSRAAVRHALLAAAFGVLLALPVASILAPPIRVALPGAAPERIASLSFATSVSTIPAVTPADERGGIAHAIPRWSSLSLSAVLLAVWLTGAIFFLLPVVIGLWQVRSLRRTALPWRHGQSVAARLALEAGIRRRVEVLLHELVAGPMTCGVLHPAIVLSPDAQTWSDEDLNRAIAHELEHVQRADWLSHCLARAVCAAYWFHPLVWIAWGHLALEAERSCDDAVLSRSEAAAYAEQLVALARHFSTTAKSPLLAMANRSDLAARVNAVLDNRQRRGRAGAFAVALACAAAALLIVTISPIQMVAAAQPRAQSPQTHSGLPTSFEVASIKPDTSGTPNHQFQEPSPGRIHTVNASTRALIKFAYSLNDSQLMGGPCWISSRGYVIDAKTDDATAAQLQKLPGDQQRQQMQLMMRSLLADRFKLAMSHQTKELPIYALTVAKGGPKLTPTAYKAPDSSWKSVLLPQHPPHVLIHPGEIDAYDQSISTLAGVLALIPDLSDRLVEDETGIKGNYDLTLRFSPRSTTPNGGPPSASAAADDGSEPSIFTALGEQLGLKIEPTKRPVDIYTIDHIEEPTPN